VSSTDGRLLSVMQTSDTPALIEQMLSIFFPDVSTILDVTYGSGAFWKGLGRDVTGMDLDQGRARDVIGNFCAIPFKDDAFDLVVFDPPYLTDTGKGTQAVMDRRFGSLKTIKDLRFAVHKGCLEAERVSRVGVLVKVQTYIHASRLVPMERWVEQAMTTDLYDIVHQVRKNKITSPKWGSQLSAYRNHASYLSFRHDGPVHKRRKVA
jgi:hypothetical protein